MTLSLHEFWISIIGVCVVGLIYFGGEAIRDEFKISNQKPWRRVDGGIPGGGGGGGGGLNATTNGGNGGAGARGEIWVISYESDPSGGNTGYGMIIG